VVSADEVAKGKPDPDIYLTACRSLGVAAAECAAVEDSSNGIRAAYAAGLRVLAVPRPQYPVEEDAQRLAAVVLTGLAAVPDALSR
jgi:beta-phosphoglucomutase-like phosphatase (HAD superfamily)